MRYWLITYQVSRDDRVTWNTFNEVATCHPAEWLLDALKTYPRLGYTNVVLTASVEIKEDDLTELELKTLKGMLE